MDETTTANIQQLVQEGRAAAMAGDNLVARARFRRATEIDPANAEAWLGLSGVVPMLAEKHEYLQRVLELEPGNIEAQTSLQYVEKLQAEGLQIAPSRRREERIASNDASPLLSSPESIVAPKIEYCYRHPDRETGLHCIQCNRPICTECAYPTPVGQVCPDDRRARRPRNYQVTMSNIIAGGLVALVTSAIAAILMQFVLGFARFFAFIVILFIGPAIAEFIVRIVDRVTGIKRGREMQVTVGVAMALGAFPLVLLPLLFGQLNLFLLLYMIISIITAVARLR